MLKRQRVRCTALLAIAVGLSLFVCPRFAHAVALADLPDSTGNAGVLSVPPFAVPDPLANKRQTEQPHRQTAQPFGLRAAAQVTGGLEALWRSAARRLPAESSILARCRADSATCPPAATRFLSVINRSASRDGWNRIAEVNRTINLDVQPVSDAAHYGVANLWPTPLMTFTANAGDCKDYAIAKFVALRELGFSADDLRIIIVHIRASAEYHAVVAVRYESHWFILDNRTSTIKRDNDVAEYEPLFVVDGENVRKMQPSPPAQAVSATPSAADVTIFAGPESAQELA